MEYGQWTKIMVPNKMHTWTCREFYFFAMLAYSLLFALIYWLGSQFDTEQKYFFLNFAFTVTLGLTANVPAKKGYGLLASVLGIRLSIAALIPWFCYCADILDNKKWDFVLLFVALTFCVCDCFADCMDVHEKKKQKRALLNNLDACREEDLPAKDYIETIHALQAHLQHLDPQANAAGFQTFERFSAVSINFLSKCSILPGPMDNTLYMLRKESFLFYNDRQDRPSNRVLATLCAASIERLIAAFRKRSHHNVQQQSAAVAEDNNMRSAPCVLLFVVSADVEELAAKMLQTLVNAHTKEDPKEQPSMALMQQLSSKIGRRAPLQQPPRTSSAAISTTAPQMISLATAKIVELHFDRTAPQAEEDSTPSVLYPMRRPNRNDGDEEEGVGFKQSAAVCQQPPPKQPPPSFLPWEHCLVENIVCVGSFADCKLLHYAHKLVHFCNKRSATIDVDGSHRTTLQMVAFQKQQRRAAHGTNNDGQFSRIRSILSTYSSINEFFEIVQNPSTFGQLESTQHYAIRVEGKKQKFLPLGDFIKDQWSVPATKAMLYVNSSSSNILYELPGRLMRHLFKTKDADKRPVFVLNPDDPDNLQLHTLQSFSKEAQGVLLLSDQSSLCPFTHSKVSLVVNYEFPTSAGGYLRRIAWPPHMRCNPLTVVSFVDNQQLQELQSWVGVDTAVKSVERIADCY